MRAKAVALNPDPKSHTAAVLTLGASEAVEVFDTLTGVVSQYYVPFGNSSGSYGGIAYSADGKYLMFSQDSSNIAIAQVLPTGLFNFAHVSVPPNNSFIKCFPNSPLGDYGRSCGTFYSTNTSYPGGVAFSSDGKSAYALLNQNDTLTKIDLTASPPSQGTQIRVGNAPHSIVLKNDNLAYVSNEGGREATKADFQIYSAGTPIVADTVNGSSTTGTVSVVNLGTMSVVNTINVGLHPTGMALSGTNLFVCNAYSDSITVIDTSTNMVSRTISLALPISVPGQPSPTFMLGPNGIAVDATTGLAYVALYNANAMAVVDLSGGATNPVMGLIPVAYAPSSVVLEKPNNQLIVANDKGIGTRLSYETDYGVSGYNSHQDNGTVSIVPLPNPTTLAQYTNQVYQNNNWDLTKNIKSAGGGSPKTPAGRHVGQDRRSFAHQARVHDHPGEPHLRSDPRRRVGRQRRPRAGGVRRQCHTQRAQPGDSLPAARQLLHPEPPVGRWPPVDRRGDGALCGRHPVAGLGAQLSGRQRRRFARLSEEGLPVPGGGGRRPFGEDLRRICRERIFPEPTRDTRAGANSTLTRRASRPGSAKKLLYQNAINVESSIPVVSDHLIKNFPQFDLNIPDQFRVDLWWQDFNNDVAAGTVPTLSILWIMDDHTGGPPTPTAEQADNDLAVGRIIDTISHSNVWDSSAIFIEEDDSQNGVDHVDGHRSPGYVISPYAVRGGPTVKTYYTQVNMTRAIEQILGLPPMNQFDLVATPMTDVFVTGTPPKANFQPFVHLPSNIPLDTGANCTLPSAAPMVSAASPQAALAETAWTAWKKQTFAGKVASTPDVVDEDVLNHYDWYDAHNYNTPYPGETYVRSPTEFKNALSRSMQGPSSRSPETRDACRQPRLDCKSPLPRTGERALRWSPPKPTWRADG